jgi:anti-sigma-K factor RskA
VTEHVTDDLGLYAAGLLEVAERRAVERHLAGCADCRAALRAEERTAWALAEAAARPAPAAVRERILAAHRPRMWTLPRVALAAAIALVLLIALGTATGGRVVALDAAGGTSARAALVTTPTGDGFLILATPTAPSGKAYEAWVIRDGRPVPAGIAGGTGLLGLRSGLSLRPGDVVAVTVEASAGAAQPTSDPILVAKL